MATMIPNPMTEGKRNGGLFHHPWKRPYLTRRICAKEGKYDNDENEECNAEYGFANC